MVTLVVGCALIVGWQALFARAPTAPDERHTMRAATGVRDNQRFVYFYHYLGLFPVATTAERLVYSRAGARRLLEERPETLLTEVGHTTRYGELGVILLYLPAAWLRGSPEALSLRPANGGAWVLALLAVFVAFWWAGHPIQGAIIVALVGSNPFQLYEVYGRENVFGWPVTAMLVLLALSVPVLGLRRPGRGAPWLVAVAAGLLVGTVRQFRPEPTALVLSVGACLLTAPRLRWRSRLGATAVLVAAFAAASWGWTSYFVAKCGQADARVAAVGGDPFPLARDVYHRVWHNVWCGLGDFDETHGYEWNDSYAYAYARRVLGERYGLSVPRWHGRVRAHLNEFWDTGRKYYKTPQEAPHYYDVLREKVLGDVARDPLWYLGILARRTWRTLSETSPVQLALGRRHLGLPMHGLVAVVVLGLLVWARAWPWVKVVAFSLPLSLPAVAVYSGGGQCLYSCYHLLAAALMLAVAVEGLLWYARGREGRATLSPSEGRAPESEAGSCE